MPFHRRARARPAVLLALLLVPAGPGAGDVLPPDGRRAPLPEEQALLSALGVVYPVGSLGGTAFLVGRCDLIATARHTIFDGRNRPFADRYLFYPQNGDQGYEARLPGAMTGNGTGERDDWILMRLADPVPGCTPMAAWAIDDADLAVQADGFFNAGYHADRDGALLVSAGCTIPPACRDAAVGGPLFVHDCDTDVGASGSPIYAVVDGEARVFAIHIRGTGPAPDICSQSNLARRVADAFAEALADMAAAGDRLRRHHDGTR